MKKLMVMATVAAMAAFAANATTRWWNRTVKNASDGKYYWSNDANWLDDNGNTGKPVAGDTVVMTNDSNVWSVEGVRLHEFILRPKGSGYGLSGSAPTFAVGSPGIRLETAQSVSYWMSISAPDGYDLPIYVCEGGSIGTTETYSGSGRFLKQGPGTLTIGNKSGDNRYTWHGTVIEGGTFQMGGYDMHLTGHEMVFAGVSSRIYLISNQTLKNVDFHETDATRPGAHSIYAINPFQLIFTGTPVRRPTTFTGRLSRTAGITWNPDDAASSLVLSTATSYTEGTLAVSNGTVRLSDGATFARLGTLDVAANGTFAVDAGSGTGFRANSVALESGATLSLGSGVNLRTYAASQDGTALAEGTYTSADNIGISGDGTLTVLPPPATEAATAVWTGEGDTTSVLVPANWGEESLPALDGGVLSATFANGGAVASLPVEATMDFAGWTLSGGFAFMAAAGAAPVGLGAGGITAADAEAATAYTLGWPLVLRESQKWTLGANNTLDVNAPLAGTGTLTVNGKARVNFNKPSSFAGDVALTNGTFYITATNAVGGAGGTLMFSLGYGALHFAGGVALDRPVTFVNTGDNNYKPFYIDANATVDFNQRVYLPSKQRAVEVGAGAVVRFHGGLSPATCFRFNGSGTVIIDTVPVTFGDRFYAAGPTIELNVAYNKINGNVGNWSSGTIKTGVPYALYHKVPAVGGTYQRILLNGATIDLCGNDQSIGVLGCGSGKITSATPATFHLIDDYVNTETQFGGSRVTNNVPFEGCVSFAKEGRLDYWLKKASPTYGDLSVTNGTLTVMSTASWANASNVTASCAGVLKVQNKDAFGRQAVIHIDGADARMLLDYSGSMKVYGLYIDGQKQPLGVYGGTASGAPRKRACFGDTGTGQLVVVGDGIGVTIIIR